MTTSEWAPHRPDHGLTCHLLADGCRFWTGELPEGLRPDHAVFERLWELHPEKPHEIEMFGRTLPTPRWQQAYERDYRFSGTVSRALPIPSVLEPFMAWARQVLDPRLNGVLVNWYDFARKHRIGPHSDRFAELVPGSPIVTISLGDTRPFFMRSRHDYPGNDFEARHGAVFVMPFETNRRWTHEVPETRRPGRRISITIRAFVGS